jgi:hypothetical protein
LNARFHSRRQMPRIRVWRSFLKPKRYL